ncbi:GNAT family N-acetyltransferase [Rhodobacteraceae bacterium 63075]|nr:GNAT family N-acetyltransferase [Rhodobacteraceae bacterium 63075]
MKLRAAHTLDAGRLGAILTEFAEGAAWFPRSHTGAEDIAHAAQMVERGWVDVAERGGEVVGFVAREGEEIHALYVRGAARCAGVGTALLDHAKANTARLALWAHQRNEAARAFYAARGFAETQRTDGAGNDEKLPDVRLVWQRSGGDG